MSPPIRVMLCPSSSGPYLDNLSEELRSQGIEVTFIPWFGKQMPYSLLRLMWSRARGFKVLHVNWMPFNSFWQLRVTTRLTKAFGIRTVWTIHNMAPHRVQFGTEEKDKEAMRTMFAWADRGVVHSERVMEAVRAEYGDGLPLDVIHHGSYADRVEPLDQGEARRALGVPEDAFAVLLLGPNRWNKGIRTYLDSISRLPEGFIGLVAGACPDPGIRDLILDHKERNPGKFMIDLRRLSDEEVAEYYAASDILLMPFERVTTSGTVIESLSHARAVITTDQGDMREWVRNGETGFLVGSVDDIVAVLSGLDRDVARRMGANGRALAFQRSWADSADRYASIFRELGRSV
ncbi:MAG TPA: glycosyltransferase family 4 protein [Methanomassiliicoccaceae archaeon]|nr:glycosyltransferase family 4 protein [Methanomassiliicoccaceae archaeon]